MIGGLRLIAQRALPATGSTELRDVHPFQRRQILLAFGALAIAPIVAHAQNATKPYRIGVLGLENDVILRQSLRDLGYVEGRDVILEFRDTEGSSTRGDDLALDLVRMKVDVIVATYPAVVLSAKRATATIPIVMMNTPDPVQLGLVASLARPGGNITGLTTLTVDLSIKQLEFLRQAVPRASRVALWWSPDNPWHPIAVKALQAASSEARISTTATGSTWPGCLRWDIPGDESGTCPGGAWSWQTLCCLFIGNDWRTSR